MYVETIDAGDFRDQIMAGISLPPSWLDEGVRYFSQWRDYSGVIAEFPDMAKLDALTFGVVVDILAKKQLTSVTINCWTELMEKLRLMVCGVNGLLFQHGIVAPCETDKPGLWAAELMRGMAIGHYDAHPMFFADFPTNIFYDTEKVLGWHCGPARPDKCAGCRAKCGKGWVIPTTRGAAGASLGRWGEVGETMTFVQYRRSGSGQWTLIAYNGTTCEGEETLGTHFYVGMPGRMREFEAFMSTNPFDHHNVAILGDFVDPLTEVARWLQAPCATAKFAK
jgi:L-fucose isomerase-like protein